MQQEKAGRAAAREKRRAIQFEAALACRNMKNTGGLNASRALCRSLFPRISCAAIPPPLHAPVERIRGESLSQPRLNKGRNGAQKQKNAIIDGILTVGGYIRSFVWWNSPAHSKPFFAITTAIISLITAAAAIVPWMIFAQSGAASDKTDTAMPVNTRETPE